MKKFFVTFLLLSTFLSTTTICHSSQYWAKTFGSNLTDHAFAIQQTEDDGYVVGYVLFWIKYENEGHIISLAVDKDYQRKQAGTKLLLKAINVLSLFKINKILLEVNENNEGAIEFYKKFNFEVDRKVPHYYNNGDGAIVMYLPVKV